jgi:hypothetical protein
MEDKEFLKYVEILQAELFAIYPAPAGRDQRINRRLKKFTYVDDSPAHVTTQGTETQKNSDLLLALVEFANQGVLPPSRSLAPWNRSFV